MTQNHYIQLDDLFLNYRYPKQDGRYPYVKNEDSSDHVQAMTYKEWRPVIELYLQELVDFLIEGYEYKLPAGMGYFYLVRTKTPRVDVEKSKVWYYSLSEDDQEEAKGTFQRSFCWDLDGYRIYLKWDRSRARGVRFQNKSFFRPVMVKPTFRYIRNKIKEDRSLLYRLKSVKDRPIHNTTAKS